ncbi:glutamate--tRNA ligase [Spectribacter hydrogenoxidans]|uniref:Glutamate--tRNA ligase n=1 Tax=Spectribacter hydrogenoxidans TaxID=3075608 RepID=A0ABU3BY76_9GAMM|nr:glutamate--tRNA ligase [Salinisphaera sp. W335]MDT0634259.1 glutamate--tRNA ligase [Salinisphaera sp. W335]
MAVTTRFAPSPTGYLHVGGARTALYSWLHARQSGGVFRLRIEDTDRERSTPEAVQAILDGMAWLGLAHDGGIEYQTERFERYRALIGQLVEAGHAYPCYSSAEDVEAMREAARARGDKPRYDGTWRPAPGKVLPEPPAGVDPVIRFATPQDGDTVVHDLVKGDIILPNSELDDLVIARGDGTPTYNFCVVVDDMDMGITHVIRGDDHVNNTPRQLAILKALIDIGAAGERAEPPQYAHVPMILGADGKRLSKRHGAVSVMAYREQGILPQALLNYLVRLGWAHGDQEIFSVDEMLAHFDISRVQGGAATFDPDKLLWVNQEHIKAAPADRLEAEFSWHLQRQGIDPSGGPALTDVIDVLRERARTLVEMAEKAAMFYQPVTGYEDKAVNKHGKPPAAERLAEVHAALAGLDDWQPEAIHAAVHRVAEQAEVGLGKVAQPIRIAVSGTAVSPPIDQTLWLLGRDESLARLAAGMEYLRGIAEDAG